MNKEKPRREEVSDLAIKRIEDMTEEEIEADVRWLYKDMMDHPERWIPVVWNDATMGPREETGFHTSELMALNLNPQGLPPMDYLRDLACRLALVAVILEYPDHAGRCEPDDEEEPCSAGLMLGELGGHPAPGDVESPAELDSLARGDEREAFRRRLCQMLDAVGLCERVASLADCNPPVQGGASPYVVAMPPELMEEVKRYARRSNDTCGRLVSLAVSQWLEEPFMPRDHEVGVALRIDGYERTVLHNKAAALGLTFGEYVLFLGREQQEIEAGAA